MKPTRAIRFASFAETGLGSSAMTFAKRLALTLAAFQLNTTIWFFAASPFGFARKLAGAFESVEVGARHEFLQLFGGVFLEQLAYGCFSLLRREIFLGGSGCHLPEQLLQFRPACGHYFYRIS